MSKQTSRTPTKEDGLDALVLSVAALLFTAALEAFRATEYHIAGILLATAFAAAVAYQALQRYHFSWEDDLNELAPDAETIATTVETAAPPVAERIRAATTPTEEYECGVCGETFDTESQLTGHQSAHS